MEPKPTIAFGLAAKSRVFPGSFSDDLDLMEGSASSSSGSSPGQSKRKRSQVPHDVISTDGEDDPDGIVGDNISDHKNKQPVAYAEDWENKAKDALSFGLTGSSTYNASAYGVTLLDMPGSSDLDLVNFNHSDGYEDDAFDFVEDDNVDFAYESYLIDNDLNSSLAAKLDDLDLPPGVEASVSWLQKHAVRSTRGKKENIDDEIELKYKAFKQFDTVRDSSDHYFASSKSDDGGTSTVKKPPKEWAKKIQSEWKVLEKDLPENIFVRVYEDRMDLLRAVIIGPAGTPYHDGLFFFDICFPSNYPHSPPLAHYHSGGLRINPNLYACGKVCLSLLNTWPGKGCEKWNPSTSTMLQVLVSIQALVLNATPYFNEPGYEQYANSPQGERLSNNYNEETFLHSCKTMLYSMRRPPLHFDVFVSGYFREKGQAILAACRAYMQGAKVGSPNLDVLPDASSEISSPSTKLSDVFSDIASPSSFKRLLKSIFEELLMEFTVKGADCNEFLVQKAKAGLVKAPDTTLKL